VLDLYIENICLLGTLVNSEECSINLMVLMFSHEFDAINRHFQKVSPWI